MLIVGQLVTPNNSKWTHQVLKFANIEGIVSTFNGKEGLSKL